MAKASVIIFSLVNLLIVAGNLLLVSNANAIEDNQGRIYNGILAEQKEFPYVVSVGEAHLCGGLIYNKNFVLTTASCVYRSRPSQLKVKAGKTSLTVQEPNEQIINVFALHIYTNFNPDNKLHNIALVETANAFVFNDYVNTIPYEKLDDSTSLEAVIAGWGATQNGGVSSTKLRKASVTIPGNCSEDYISDVEFFPEFMFCGGDFEIDQASPCVFDEGSPVVDPVNGIALGLMSYNKGCNPDVNGYVPPTIYTRLDPYTSWMIRYDANQAHQISAFVISLQESIAGRPGVAYLTSSIH